MDVIHRDVLTWEPCETFSGMGVRAKRGDYTFTVRPAQTEGAYVVEITREWKDELRCSTVASGEYRGPIERAQYSAECFALLMI